MRSKRTPSGAFPEELFFEKEEIDDICLSALKESGYFPKEPGPVRIERFVERHFGCMVSYRDLGEGIMGCTKFNSKGKVEEVVVSSRLEDGTPVSQRRARTTFAHEGGHGLLHATLFIDQGQQGFHFGEAEKIRPKLILCRDEDIAPDPLQKRKGYDGKWWEYQANRAIGGFLLPKALVRQAIAPYLDGPQGLVKLKPIKRAEATKDLAELFDVNPVVVRIRLSEMFPDESAENLI